MFRVLPRRVVVRVASGLECVLADLSHDMALRTRAERQDLTRCVGLQPVPVGVVAADRVAQGELVDVEVAPRGPREWGSRVISAAPDPGGGTLASRDASRGLSSARPATSS